MNFIKYKNNLYPLIAILSSLLILVVGLVMAKSIKCTYFLTFVLFWLIMFGCYKQVIKMSLIFIVIGGCFTIICYFSSNKNIISALSMLNRFGTVFIAIVPSISVKPVAMTRNLSQLHTPRSIVLGLLITISYLPVLKMEIKRVSEAMKTRGVGSIFNPKIFYRAFLIPLITRIVDISDTLSLSIETRGFTLGKSNYTIYKKEKIYFLDVIYILGLIISIILVVLL